MQNDGNAVDYQSPGGASVWSDLGSDHIAMPYNQVSADFYVPTPNGGPGTMTYVWDGLVGSGGSGYSTSIVQAGTWDGYYNGGENYGLWWENYPNGPFGPPSTFPLTAGNEIYVYIYNPSATTTD